MRRMNDAARVACLQLVEKFARCCAKKTSKSFHILKHHLHDLPRSRDDS